MAIPAPVILLPSNGVDYTTDMRTQTLSGTTSANTQQIRVNSSVKGVSYTPGETAWSWTGTLDPGLNTVEIVGIEKVTGLPSPTTTIKITVTQQDIVVTVSSPTGVRLRRYQNRLEPICSKNPEENVVGYNFYVSYQSGGVNNQYVKINSSLVTLHTFYEDSTTQLGQTVETVGNIRITTTTEEVVRNFYYSYFFTQDIYNALVYEGAIPNVGFNQQTKFYFIITAVIYDPLSGQVTESSYSPELEGSVVTITTGINDIPGRTQNDIIQTFTRELLAANSNIDMKPGTVLRDMMDPVSEEQARTYVIQDFLSRALSVSTLLDFDDANGDGISDTPSQSSNKKALQIALYLNDVNEVQRIIDDQFDKLASNVNIIRRGSTSAVGSVVFYTQTPPIRDMQVNEGAMVASLGDVDQGIAAQTYRCTETKIMSYANSASYFNAQTQQYELEVAVEAVTPGSAGNTDSYTIKSINSGADSDFLVENPNPIEFGQDRESNYNLSSRLMLAYYADTGTEGGYARTTVSVPGVRGVRIEKTGDPLMMRDYDATLHEHIGGKVDVYVQGTTPHEVSDTIAFAFESGIGGLSGEQFSIINAVAFQFQSQNPNVTAHTPIFEVSRVYNSTRAKDYDITGYIIIGDGDTIQLDSTLPTNIAIGLASSDIIRVDYKYRSSDTFILQHQPVSSITSVVGQLSGTLPSENYELVKLQDPVEEGGSTIAKDGLRIIYANGLPVTDFQTITNESHVLIEGIPDPLVYIGVDPLSIVVTDTSSQITYVKDQDYTVILGNNVISTKIQMVASGEIVSGQTVNVSYVAIENFIISYSTNTLLSDVQTSIDAMKHACADVIAKQAVLNGVDFIITIIPKSGVSNFEHLTSQIQTAVSNYIGQIGLGVSLTQAEIVKVIQSVSDVDYVVLPFIKMAKSDGSFIVRDDIGNPTFQVFNQGVAVSYITTTSVLHYKTTDQGGPNNLFRGVFEDNLALVLQTDPLDVSGGPGRAYIQADGKIIVTTKDGNLPDTKSYQVAYYTQGETGSSDIQTNTLEYLKVGSFSITYDTPRQVGKQSF